MTAQSLIKYTARLRWVDAAGYGHTEHHAHWTARRATEMAWKRARSMMLSGAAKAYRIEHHEPTFEDGSVRPVDCPFAIPAMEAAA